MSLFNLRIAFIFLIPLNFNLSNPETFFCRIGPEWYGCALYGHMMAAPVCHRRKGNQSEQGPVSFLPNTTLPTHNICIG